LRIFVANDLIRKNCREKAQKGTKMIREPFCDFWRPSEPLVTFVPLCGQ
jgi:hypothetical protein